jgi:outer membrane protein TolC
MKKTFIFIYLLCAAGSLAGQPLQKITIEQSYKLAQENYPLTKQRGLIARTKEYSLSNAAKGVLPLITINGQDSYQSDVTSIPMQSPEMNIEELSKHQYKVYGEVAANLYDGGAVRNQKELHRATAKIDEQQLEVQLYQLKDRVNQMYFGVLLLDAQLEQNDLLKSDIRRGLQQVEARIANGTALKSSADVLEAEYLKANQKTIELKASRKAFTDMLTLLLAVPLDESTDFEKPGPLDDAEEITRPELSLYQYQRDAINVQNRMLATRNRPRLSLFFQGGYGRPALDMLNNSPEAYYITGLRLNWTISGFYTLKKERALLRIEQSSIDLQRETFLHNTKISLKSQSNEVTKLQDIMASDDEIIRLREKITQTASAQLENGVITSNDYLREVTAEDQARQNRIMHEIQLLLAQYNLHTTAGI